MPSFSENREIIISLSETGDARILQNPKEFIQIDARDKFEQLIDDRIETIKHLNGRTNTGGQETGENCKKLESILCDDDCDFDSSRVLNRCHDTILIDGERGTGKTTFALNMFEYIRNNKKIANLGILDPTLIENKEHILINIISRIKKRIDCFFTYCKNDKTDYEYYNVWKKQLAKLAAGLSLLDGIGGDGLKSEVWDSPELAMEEGIDNAVSGQELEKDLHKFIELSLKILCQEAFILFLDDIDTSIDKGFVIMEVLRKYLTSPRLIIVLLGDIKLYSLIVKQLQYEKIDPKKILKDYLICGCIEDKHIENEQIKGYIDVLQDQYLTKILKPEFRITLRNIYDYIDYIKINNVLDSRSDVVDEILLKYILKNNFCLNVFSLKESEVRAINAITEFVCKLPTRTFLQLMKIYHIYCEPADNQSDKIDFISSLKNMFVAYFDDGFLKDQNIGGELIINRISEYLITNKYAYSGDVYELLPLFRETKRNVNMFTVNAVSSFILQKEPDRLFEYMVKLYLPKYCADSAESNKLFLEEKSRTKTVIDYLSLETDEESMNIAKKAVVFFEGTTNLNPFISGFIHVNKSVNKEKDIINKSLFLNTILFNITYLKSNSSYLFSSFFAILSLMSEVLSLVAGENANNIEYKAELIKEKLLKYSEIKKFGSLFNQDRASEVDEVENKSDSEVITKSDKDAEGKLKDFCTGLAQWSGYVNQLEPVSIPMFNKIWSNFMSNINDIDENLRIKSSDENFASILHRYGIAFLNAVFVESQPGTAISRKNPIKYDSVFNQKIKDKDCTKKTLTDPDNKNKISLFNFIFSCPLWGIYLDIINETENTENKFITDCYFRLQMAVFNKEKKEEIIEIFKGHSLVNITKKIKFSKIKEMLSFSALDEKAKESEIKSIVETLPEEDRKKIKNRKSDDDEDVLKIIEIVRDNLLKKFSGKTVSRKTTIANLVFKVINGK